MMMMMMMQVTKMGKLKTKPVTYETVSCQITTHSIHCPTWPHATSRLWCPISQRYYVKKKDGTIASTQLPTISVAKELTTRKQAYIKEDGLRWSGVLCTLLLALSAGLRCIPVDGRSEAFLWIVYIAQIINGVAGTFPLAGPALFSSTWFPQNQRATSTALAVAAPTFGAGMSFILGPLMIRDINKKPYDNETSVTTTTTSTHEALEFGVTMALFLVVLLYFPAHPPKPPSISATKERTPFLQGLKDLFRIPSFWCVLVVFGLTGVPMMWIGVFTSDLVDEGISELEGGWIGFYAQVAGALGSLLVARFGDIFAGYMKTIAIVFTAACAGSMTLFFLLGAQVIPFSKGLLYFSSIATFASLFCIIPLIFELSCEVVYPVAEGVTGGVLTVLNQLLGVVFIFAIMNQNSFVMNCFVLGSIVACLPLLLVMRIQYKRSDVDTGLNKIPHERIIAVNGSGETLP